MAQPIDIISGALKDIGALAVGETPTAEAAADAFQMMNGMVDQWSNESMMVSYKLKLYFLLHQVKFNTQSALAAQLVLILLVLLVEMY